ncbi:ABC transporter ATP-binding protein [Paenibacillus sp. FSL K6-1096]|uniref:ABC transporter ATP-binding protein n=1 Tax=Paenibacillus sp. FSL K6-1096 TaxID=2921460 RepID=UPI0030EB1D9D
MTAKTMTHVRNIIMIVKLFCTRDLTFSLGLMALTALLAPLGAWFYKLLIDGLPALRSVSDVTHKLLILVAGYAVLKIILDCCEHLTAHVNNRLKYNINREFIRQVNKKLSVITMEELENPAVYDLLERVQSNVNKGILAYINNALSVALPVFSIFSYIVLLMRINLYFPLIAVAGTVPYLLLMNEQGRRSYFQAVEQSKPLRRLNYMYEVLTSRKYAKEIRMFGLIDYLNDRTETIRHVVWKEKFRLLLHYTLGGALVDLFRNVALGICLLITVTGVLDHSMSIGDVMLIITSMQAITDGLSSMVNKISSMNSYTLYMEDLLNFLNLPEYAGGGHMTLTDSDASFIRFRNVDFSYPGSANLTLKNIDITIHKGEKIALVGENGCGKSTFIHLLLGLYKPTSGEVLIGEKALGDVLEAFRKKTVCVFQNFLRYQFSVADNIRAGNFGQDFQEQSLRNLGIESFIRQLPQGLDTQLGQLEHNDIELSGGQWQRLAIARALSRPEAEILIMDEPTASLDPKVETQIYEEFSELCQNRTAIMISHRLGVTRLCDMIYVFDQGEICESGSHAELMKHRGKYYEMYTAQSYLYA